MAIFTFNTKATTVVLPADDYILRIKEVQFTKSKAGDDMVKIGCKIMDQQAPMIFDYFPLTIKMAWKFSIFLKAIQRKYQEGAVIDVDQNWLNHNAKGALGWASIKIEQYEGKDLNKIDKWLPIDEEHPDPYDKYEREEHKEEFEVIPMEIAPVNIAIPQPAPLPIEEEDNISLEELVSLKKEIAQKTE